MLANGGHTGGWEQLDHNLFVKLRKKFKAKAEFIDEFTLLVAIKSRQQVESHEEWYKKYLNLNEIKKKSIKHWRENKQVNFFTNRYIFFFPNSDILQVSQNSIL